MRATLIICDDTGRVLSRTEFNPLQEGFFDYHHQFAVPHHDRRTKHLLWSGRWVPVATDDPVEDSALRGFADYMCQR